MTDLAYIKCLIYVLWFTSVHTLQALYYANTHSPCYCTVLTVLLLIGELEQKIYDCFIWLWSFCLLRKTKKKTPDERFLNMKKVRRVKCDQFKSGEISPFLTLNVALLEC